MSSVSDKLLHDIAKSVRQRVVAEPDGAPVLPARFTVLALSGGGKDLATDLDRLGGGGSGIVAVADCPTGSRPALAVVLARMPGVQVLDGEQAFDTDRLVGSAERVVAPAMDLSLASRVVAMQGDTPSSRVIARALLRGVPVTATLDSVEFSVSERAPEGARLAVGHTVERLRSLGVEILGPSSWPLHEAPAARAVASAGGAAVNHPSRDRFSFPEPIGEFVEFLEKRPCMLETGKPCIDCGVCESRGF